MKSITNILRRSNITPLERVTALVHNDVYREKNGKNLLSDSDIYVLTKAWNPRTFEAQEYNRYINIVKLESSMQMDAQMFLCKSEITLLRNQRVIDGYITSTRSLHEVALQQFTKDIPKEESIKLLVDSTYFEYQKLLHIFTFNNLPKEIQADLLLLDDAVAIDNKYLEDQVFLYERFNDINGLNKDLIINQIYSCMYYEGAKKLKNSTAEKDGFLLHHFFAELPVIDIFKKILTDSHIQSDDTEENLVSDVEKYARSKNLSIESLIKETLSKWLDEGLFVNDYSPLFMSECFDTWNGDTKNNHKALFMVWYTELQKSKECFQSLFDSGKLNKKILKKDFLRVPKSLEIITGDSLYACKEDIDFVIEYQQQIETLLPLTSMFLFVKKYATPVRNYKTLCEFKNLAQKFSSIFDIDIAERYCEFVDLYKEELNLLNHSLTRLVDIAIEYLYTEKSLRYITEITDDDFIFDINSEDSVAEIAESYSAEFKKIE